MAATCLAACNDEPELIQPAVRGQRGEACQARNDCASGLACVSNTCSKNDFQITVTAKHCDRIDCSTDSDCCGDRPLVAPAKCDNRVSTCATPYLPGCERFQSCDSDSACGPGTCGSGYCSTTFDACDANADCVDTCVGGYCSLSLYACSTDDNCAINNTCTSRECVCTNPAYNPIDPICSDPDCEDICNLRCEDELCVVDNSCTEDIDCFPFGLLHCQSGACVECETDDECTDEGEVCQSGACIKPCTVNEECPLFHQCQSGDCVETGCTSDRECVLALSRSGSLQDARLSKCLPSDEDPSIKTCKIPCENDAACTAEFEVCSEGFCTFIGCESNEDCRAFLGLEEVQTTPSRPYISTAECR